MYYVKIHYLCMYIKQQPTAVLSPGKSHGQRSVRSRLQSMGSWRVGHDSNFTFTFQFHALEKEMATHCSVLAWRIPGMGAWWAAILGVTQSWTRLTWLSSSIKQHHMIFLPSVQFSSVTQSCPTLWDPMNHSTPGFPKVKLILSFDSGKGFERTIYSPWSFPYFTDQRQHQVNKMKYTHYKIEVSSSLPLLLLSLEELIFLDWRKQFR